MKRKKLYTFLFISLFLISTIAVIAQPAAGAKWTFAVPDQVKGMTLYVEVKAYDKDAWGDHLGFNQDNTANAYFGKDTQSADDVGKQYKYKVINWEKADIQYIDYQLSTLQPPSKRADYIDGYASMSFIRNTIIGMADSTVGSGLVESVRGAVDYLRGLGPIVSDATSTLINDSQELFLRSTLSTQGILQTFAKTYVGVELERELWYFAKDLDTKPDEKSNMVPYIRDPHKIYDTYLYLLSFYGYILQQIQDIRDAYSNFRNAIGWSTSVPIPPLNVHTWGDTSEWDYINTTLYQGVLAKAMGGDLTAQYLLYAVNLTFPTGFGNDFPFAFWYLIDDGLNEIQESLMASIRNPKEYLAAILRAGLPAHAPVDKWWQKVVDDFNIDDDHVWYNLQGDANKGGVYMEGKTVVIDYEWVNVQDKHGDKLEDRDDYQERYTYGDTGGQSSLEFTDGDNVFYRIEALSPAIPGYEITILLASAAISALGLIYVVMKKRRK